MKRIKKLGLAVTVSVLMASGCANHANIGPIEWQPVSAALYEQKTLKHEVFYSQPEPGLFNEKKQQELTLLSDASLSVAAADALENFDQLLAKYAPTNTTVVANDSDLMLRVTLVTPHKKGPAFYEHQFMSSLGKNLVTLGFAGSDYHIVADFDIDYALYEGERLVHRQEFRVNERIPHTAGDLEFNQYETLDKARDSLFEKHIGQTLTEFYRAAAQQASP